jgi:hypothetical protein
LWRTGIATPDDPSDDVRFVPYVLDDDESGTFNLPATHPNAGADEHSISGGDNDPYSDWIYWATPDDITPGDAGYRAWEAAALAIPGLQDDGSFYQTLATDNTMRRMVLVNFNGGSISAPTYPANLNAQLPETGTVFRIISTKPNTANDVFTFSTNGLQKTVTAAAAQKDVEKIQVFPNPYLGFNRAETSINNKFITFSHLPTKATLRIFDLAGTLVRKLEKDDSSQFLRWDLLNQNGLPAASGIYIVHVDMPAPVGKTKTMKLMIIQEEQQLQYY